MTLIKISCLSIFYLTFLMERVIPMDPYRRSDVSEFLDDIDEQHFVEGDAPKDNEADFIKWADDELNKWKASESLDESGGQHVVEGGAPNDMGDCYAQWLQYEINNESSSKSLDERNVQHVVDAFAFSNPNYSVPVMTDQEFEAFSICKKEIYDFFNWGSILSPHRDMFPKKAFKKMKYDSFKKDGEPEKVAPRGYYYAVLDDLCAKPDTLNVDQWCADKNKRNTKRFKNCIGELRKYFVDNDDASQVLRNAYYCIMESNFVSKRARVYIYFLYLSKQMDHKPTVQGFRTPYEFCINSPAIIETKDMSNKGDKPQTGNEFEPSSSNFPSDDPNNSDG